MVDDTKQRSQWRDSLYRIIFQADTPAGKAFDITLVITILVSVSVVMLDSVAAIHARYDTVLFYLEWLFTIMFTLEYLARVVSVHKPTGYMFSFMGLVDLLSTLPSYIALFVAAPAYSMSLRLLRLLRIFRVLKLAYYLEKSAVMA